MRPPCATPSPRTSPLWAPSTPIRAGCTNRPTRTSLCSTNSAGSISSSDIRTKKIRGPRGRTRVRGRPSESSRSDVRAVQDGAVGRLDSVGDPLDAERFEDLLAGPHAHPPAGVRIGQDATDLVREAPRAHRVAEAPVPAVLDHLAPSRDRGDD